MDIVTKTFRAPNMLLALQQVQRELGSDAIVVSMRKVPSGPAWQVWREPVVEVIAMKNAGQPVPLTAENKKEISEKVLKQSESSASITSADQEPEKQFASRENQNKKEKKNKANPRPAANLLDVINQYQAQTTPILIRDDESEIPEDKNDEVIIGGKDSNELKQEIRKIIDSLTTAPTTEPAGLLSGDVSKPEHPPRWKPFVPPRVDLRQRTAEQKAESYDQTTGVAVEEEKKEESVDTEFNIIASLPKSLSNTRDLLMKQEIDPDFVDQMIATCHDILPKKSQNDNDRIRTLLQRQFEAEIRTLSANECFSSKNIFLVGSSGSGKTSSCAKLAAYALHTLGKQVNWVCADTIRTSAIAEARTFTDLLSVPLTIAYTPEDLKQNLNSNDETDFFMVDTINCNPRSEASIVEIGDFITQATSRVSLMVISATTKPVDIKQALAAFRPFRIKGLIITKLDESLTFGSIYNLARQSQLPLCFFSKGTHVFNDLLPATPQALVDSLFGEGFAK